MEHTFYKYQGTGNDFVILDNRNDIFDKTNKKLVAHLCDRKFGIGADGLILLENHDILDFTMVYYNADGKVSSMCGNGGRCLIAFAKFLGIIVDSAVFEAIDGEHHAIIEGEIVKLKMQNVSTVQEFKNHVFVDTGSPHHIEFVEDLVTLDVKSIGECIRYGAPYNDSGANVNFVNKINDDTFAVRTYERGVEDETLSCGTGVTAVAIAMNYIGETKKNIITLKTEGGDLKVTFQKNKDGFSDVWLIGPAIQVYKGEISW